MGYYSYWTSKRIKSLRTRTINSLPRLEREAAHWDEMTRTRGWDRTVWYNAGYSEASVASAKRKIAELTEELERRGIGNGTSGSNGSVEDFRYLEQGSDYRNNLGTSRKQICGS